MTITRSKPGVDQKHIELSLGWYLEVPTEPDEDGREQGFVFRPDGRESASIDAALGLGHLTGNDETPIPPQVRATLRKHEEKYA